jgi:ABC-2 type transport system ATP-binding protein
VGAPVPGGLVVAEGLHGISEDLLTGNGRDDLQRLFYTGDRRRLGGLGGRLGGCRGGLRGDDGNILPAGGPHHHILPGLLDGSLLDRRAGGEKRRLSVITQEYSMRQDMTMEEVMEYQGRLYFMKKKDIRQKTEELLKFTGLLEYRRRTVRHLSGGMKRKLMICRALMTEPEILLLDEPTAGMDALSRRQTWTLLRKLQSRGMTVLLTTHYMEEAQALCDRVALMDRGRIDIIAPPRDLIEDLGGFAVDETGEEKTVSRFFKDREEAIRYLSEAGTGAVLRMTNLEDVFVERLGRRLQGR